MNLIDLYKKDINEKKIFYDEKQKLVINELNNLRKIIEEKEKKKENIFFSDILNFFNKEISLGLYIWGDVGRGKTYLVDLFYSSLETKKKKRIHFHHFMKTVHEKLKELEGEKDPLKKIARWMYKNNSIICLDEFFVKDIADAMTLSGLFKYLFELNVHMVITSNVIPNKLYEGGLQRQKFIQTIFLIEKHLKIINVDGSTDYRFRNLKKENTYINPINIKNLKKFKTLFNKISVGEKKRKKEIKILNRSIKTLYVCESNVWFDFNILCGEGRSQLDYIEITNIFDIIFLSNIKIMTQKNEDIARRFISLIDEIYDRKKNLILLADAKIDELYKGEILKFDFKRTISRLNEMSTAEYIKDFDKNVF